MPAIDIDAVIADYCTRERAKIERGLEGVKPRPVEEILAAAKQRAAAMKKRKVKKKK